MSNWIIETENLGKKYRLRHAGAGHGYVTLREAMIHGLKRISRPLRSESATCEDFWALDDLSFRVGSGETVAIIGRNGAGKSTLLKILSRITEPTVGRVRLKGRVSSLLEVGTGFHPELTGRENIYLNGTILGMPKKEVDRKFDAIVDFAGVEKFVDTAVKHFSSGMQVRLAFAVAAHLEPEILIIDEVLAVGDAVFQKKCLGKMQDVAADGRTVLFVSHDLAAVEKLCSRAILLEGGRCRFDGPTPETIATYQESVVQAASLDLTTRQDRRGAGAVRFTKMELLDENSAQQSVFLSGKPLRVRMHYCARGNKPLENCRVSVTFNGWGKIYFVASTELVSDDCLDLSPEGFIDCIIDELPLSLGTYYLGPFIEVNGQVQDWLESAATLQVEDGNFFGTGRNYPQGGAGATVLVRHRWQVPTESRLETSRGRSS
jgi:homopolymeric O-antigen transport system ATP-binding protein